MTTAITIQNDTIPVTPDDQHEYVLSSAQVAKGYGVSASLIREHKRKHADELIEGKHWVVSKTDAPRGTGGGRQSATYWTKRGIVRLGFFIKSARAKLFRDLAEDLVLRVSEQPLYLSPAYLRQLADMVEHNGLLVKYHDLLTPHGHYGELNKSGQPKNGLVAPYWRAGMRDRFLAQQVRALQGQLEFIQQLMAAA